MGGILDSTNNGGNEVRVAKAGIIDADFENEPSDDTDTDTDTDDTNPNVSIVQVSDAVWDRRADTFYPSTTAQQSATLPPGVYAFEEVMGGWRLKQTARGFEFPYKVYGLHDKIVRRVLTAWDHVEGTLGILFDGLKGTGKTIAAQVLANALIKQDVPVIVVAHPVPLGAILAHINQDVMVILDEFEKTHKHADHQQALLSVIDGMSRARYRRLFLFTTNTRTIDPALVDRPSRIRYAFEFGRLEQTVIDALLDDLLDPTLSELRGAITSYLNTRAVISIDTAMAAIREVNLFREAPAEWQGFFNLSEQHTNDFTVELLDDKRNVIRVLAHGFSPGSRNVRYLAEALARGTGRAELCDLAQAGTGYDMYGSTLQIRFKGTTEEPSEWIAEIAVPNYDTWISRFPRAAQSNELRWLDRRPEGWTVPKWAPALEANKRLTAAQDRDHGYWLAADTVYGTNERAKVLLRIKPNLWTRGQRNKEVYGDWNAGEAF